MSRECYGSYIGAKAPEVIKTIECKSTSPRKGIQGVSTRR